MACEIYRSENLLVRGMQTSGSSVCVVTFDSYTDHRTLDRPGFGEAFLETHQIDAIHFIQKNNKWYLYSDLSAACALVKELTKRYDKVIAYGQSMGGYAAIRFGREIGASLAVAISPQFSVNPKVVPFDKRWISDAAGIDFSMELTHGSNFTPTAYVIFDPHTLDARHVEMYRPFTHLIEARLPNSGHPSTGFLAEAGILKEVILRICSGDLDSAWLRTKARAARRQSAQFYYALAVRCRSASRKLMLATQANNLIPHNPAFLGYYAYVCGLNNQFETAHRLFADARLHGPHHNTMQYWESELYRLRGDLKMALEITEEVLKRDPGVPVFVERHERLFAEHWIQRLTVGRTKAPAGDSRRRASRSRQIVMKFAVTCICRIRRFFSHRR